MTTAVYGEVARSSKVLLREKLLGDATDDFRWRSEPELNRYDAARPLTVGYQEYLALYREELLYPSPYRRSLAIEDETGRHIGNVMYYNIDAVRHEAELGITIGERDYWGQGYGSEAARLLVEVLLTKRGFRRVHLKTLSWNRRARRSFEKVGFVECGRSYRSFEKVGFVECGRSYRSGNSFMLMEIRREWLTPADQPDDAVPATV